MFLGSPPRFPFVFPCARAPSGPVPPLLPATRTPPQTRPPSAPPPPGVLNFIPSVGPLVATVIPLPVVIVSPGRDSLDILLAVSLPVMTHFVIGHIVEPKLMGDSLELHPITVGRRTPRPPALFILCLLTPPCAVSSPHRPSFPTNCPLTEFIPRTRHPLPCGRCCCRSSSGGGSGAFRGCSSRRPSPPPPSSSSRLVFLRPRLLRLRCAPHSHEPCFTILAAGAYRPQRRPLVSFDPALILTIIHFVHPFN